MPISTALVQLVVGDRGSAVPGESSRRASPRSWSRLNCDSRGHAGAGFRTKVIHSRTAPAGRASDYKLDQAPYAQNAKESMLKDALLFPFAGNDSVN